MIRGVMNRLTDTRLESIVRAAKKKAHDGNGKPMLVADGAGLYLQITKSGSSSWLFRYMRAGKAVGIGLGGYPTVGLQASRERAVKCRQALEAGQDPLENKRQAAKERVGLESTFDTCAKKYIADHRQDWRNEKHAQQWENTLATYAAPIFGDRPIGQISTEDVQKVLQPIWLEKGETARRLRGRIESIMDWATVLGYRQGANPARFKGHLEHLLPRGTRESREKKHFPALPYAEMSDFMELLGTQDGVARWALEFLILTAARTSEVLGATWQEVDLDNAVWSIPGKRMKAGRDHRVPLCAKAIAVLKHMQTFDIAPFIFFGRNRERPLSNMAMTVMIRRTKYQKTITVHGFRSAFRDWAAEMTDHDSRVAESALAHTDPNKVRSAYLRGDLWGKRVAMMNQWEAYCFKPSSICG